MPRRQPAAAAPATSNALYYGDNLEILRRHVADESVDLVYLDPPFKSNQDYNVLFAEADGARSAAQIKVFEDTWEWNEAAARSYEEVVETGPPGVQTAMRSLRQMLGDSDMMAYLAMMAPRLVELRRVLKRTGSIYLHCDATASHYLKLLMDAAFGVANFRNEIHWYYYNKMHDRRKKLFPRATDTILFYVKDIEADFTYHQLKEKRDEPVRQLLRKKVGGKMVNVKDDEGHVVYRVKDDRTIDNVWRIPCLQPAAPERLGYPTQKPVALLERIIEASTNEGDTVLDPFCGCGTTVHAAQILKRHWIGIDVTALAIALIKNRLLYGTGAEASTHYSVIGEPVTLEDASVVAEEDPYQFQWWALGLLGARPSDPKKGADRGIDGRLLFHDEMAGGKTKQIIISVKAGTVTVSQLRDLRGVMDRESAQIGALVSFNEPTSAMRREAASAGFYTSPWDNKKRPRIQLLTIGEILAGKGLDYAVSSPVTGGNVTVATPRRGGRKRGGDKTDKLFK
jgi:site-specific DNA-methyltransferase (adenine-specific)